MKDLIITDAPEKEPERQLYFIEKCREWVREHYKDRKPTMNIKTFGCQMNAKDSEKIEGILSKIGFVGADDEKADFVLYNTCTVRENANLKVYGRLGHLKKVKEKNPDMLICLCGCMMQENEVIEKIRKSYRFVDIVFGTHNIFKVAELLYNRIVAKSQIIDIWKDTDMIVENLPSVRKYSFKAGVNIMYGCNNFCTYCIVPYVRGRERSRNPKDIICEIESLVKDGVVEVMLLGQNVNSYGKTLDEPMSFAELLEEVEKIEGLKRIRFMTSHPKDLSDDLIRVMKNSKKICNHLHLPLQSGSSDILKKMNRHYTKEQYLDLVKKIKENLPDISLTTDIIVGFPNETDQDIEETIDVIKQVEFDSAFTFVYSRRTGTPAAKIVDTVPESVVKERFDKVLKVVQNSSAINAKKLEGKTMEVLVEEQNDHDESLVTGRLSNNLLVHFKGNKELIGSLVNVKLNECKGFYYIGEMVY
ncbi:MAG: tRNA (N6-isopentenyl adenosine(37)-C2)-methylthiotransferase MiaB [Lachnospiraceae bacterium]|nr:tRNA (N6-isopentenyl adenosine(37)-C2)-methylthiotransferase MiaB [Lachnospiraceae bacterium]